jgi:hypothetical protein
VDGQGQRKALHKLHCYFRCIVESDDLLTLPLTVPSPQTQPVLPMGRGRNLETRLEVIEL